jgi:hypothetical protein
VLAFWCDHAMCAPVESQGQVPQLWTDGSQCALGSDASAIRGLGNEGFPNESGQSKSRYPRESIRPLPPARNILQFGHGALQGC